MIRLGARPLGEPVTAEVWRGVTITYRPITYALYEAARSEAQERARMIMEERGLILDVGGRITDIPDVTTRAGLAGLTEEILVQCCARQQIVSWTGIGNADGTADEPCTPDAVTMLVCQEPLIADRIKWEILGPIYERSAEGNALAAVPGGIGAAAEKSTADSAKSSETLAQQAEDRHRPQAKISDAPTTATPQEPSPAS